MQSAINELKALEVNDISKSDVDKMIEDKMAAEEKLKSEETVKNEEKFKLISTNINKIEESLKQEIDLHKENHNQLAKNMTEQISKINHSVEALNSKIYVNKE